MANVIVVKWGILLTMYHILQPSYLPTYLLQPTYYNLPTYLPLYLATYYNLPTHSPTYLPTYYNLFTYPSTHLRIITYLST
jgi:hypothetical protein